MISQLNTSTLYDFAPVQWHTIEAKTAGDFLVVRPSFQVWNSVISRIQDFVTKEFQKEGITTWTSTPYHLAHMTLFMPIHSTMTVQEKKALMLKVAEKIASLKPFDIVVNVSDQTTKLKRGPFKYVTLQFNSEDSMALHAKIKEAIQEAIDQKLVRPETIDINKLNKPISGFKPHLTVGILDVTDPHHSDVARLNDIEAKKKFGKSFKTAFKQFSFKFPVQEVALLGTKNLQAKVSEKEYYTLATVPIGRQEQARVQIRKVDHLINQAFAHRLQSLFGSTYQHVAVVRTKDEAQQPTYRVSFISNPILEQQLHKQLGAKIHPSRETHPQYAYIQVGEKRSKMLFGEEIGNTLYHMLTMWA